MTTPIFIGKTIRIDVGSAAALKESYTARKAEIDKVCRIASLEELERLLQNTLPKYPFPSFAQNGRQIDSRWMELVCGAVCVDELRKCFSSGFRVQARYDEKMEMHIPQTRATLLAVASRLPPGAGARVRGLMPSKVLLDASALQSNLLEHASFFFYRSLEANRAAARKEMEEVFIRSCFDDGEEPAEVTEIWTMVDGFQEGWFCVGVRENDKKMKMCLADPETLAVFFMTDEPVVSMTRYYLIKQDGIPAVFDKMKQALCHKMPFCYVTPTIKKLEKASEGHKAAREVLCGAYDKNGDPEFAFGDCCQYEAGETLAAAEQLGVNVLTLAPVAAMRPEYTWSKSGLEFESFLKYMQLCEVEEVIVPNTEMRRIAECIMSIDRGGGDFSCVKSYTSKKIQGFPLDRMK